MCLSWIFLPENGITEIKIILIARIKQAGLFWVFSRLLGCLGLISCRFILLGFVLDVFLFVMVFGFVRVSFCLSVCRSDSVPQFPVCLQTFPLDKKMANVLQANSERAPIFC